MPGARGRVKGQVVKKSQTKSSRCDLIFPVGRCNSLIRKGRYAKACGVGGGIFMAAVLEYVCCEVLELAGNACSEQKKKQITPRHIMLAMKNDEEINKLLATTTIATGGTLPNIHGFLFGKQGKNQKYITEGATSQQM